MTIARSRYSLKAMREVSRSWQEGFEGGVRSINVSRGGPELPRGGQLARRFPGLVLLNIGDSLMDEDRLLDLWDSNPKLTSLVLNGPELSAWCFPPPLGLKLTANGLSNLSASRLTELSLKRCRHLEDSDLVSLMGMPLRCLVLDDSTMITNDGLEYLQGMPLRFLSLNGLNNLTGDGLRLLKDLPLTRLALDRCNGLGRQDLEHLRGLPLTRLSLSRHPQRPLAADPDQICDASLESLLGMQLTTLCLRNFLTDAGMPLLRKLPLMDLTISESGGARWGVTNAGFQHLRGLQLTRLTLTKVKSLSDTGLSFLQGMPLTDLSIIECDRVTTNGMVHLHGLPLKILDIYCRSVGRDALKKLRDHVKVSHLP